MVDIPEDPPMGTDVALAVTLVASMTTSKLESKGKGWNTDRLRVDEELV